MSQLQRPILYSFRRCPYAMRARLAITSSGIQCELREIVLRDKSPEFVALSPKATVPVVLDTNGTVLEESLDVMYWALQAHDPENLLSEDADRQEAMQVLIGRADGPFKRSLDRYKYANRYDGADPVEERGQGAGFLLELDGRLARSEWLFGDAPSLADIAILPFVRQFAFVDRDWFETQSWPNLLGWLDRFLASDRFLSVMQKYSKWESGDPVIMFPE